MHRSVSRALARALAATLAATVATGPALAQTVHVVQVRNDGTFDPKYLDIASGDTVEWRGLRPTDALARLSTPALRAVFDTHDPTQLDRAAVCSTGQPDDPGYIADAHVSPYRQAYEHGSDDELTGPGRRGVSGIWALGPEGGEVSDIEIPGAEATALHAGIAVTDGCGALADPAREIALDDDPRTAGVVDPAWIRYRYTDHVVRSGDDVHGVDLDAVVARIGDPTDEHRLCQATALLCNADNSDCDPLSPDAADPRTIPPGTYLNGLMTSTYENPDVTGVVLRFNWKDLQYDDGGEIKERWQHLDRELERAIAHGKLVTFDVRAGMFGTPDWIFRDYLRLPDDAGHPADPAHAASWCAAPGPCTFTGPHPDGAGQVQALNFVDHYDETPPGDGCGSPVRIGAPGEQAYRDLYKGFIQKLAEHLREDTRRWQAIAHVKVSGANMRTSEAELPHHCDDRWINTAGFSADPKDTTAWKPGDRVLDVFKTLHDDLTYATGACTCNTRLWWKAGYVPQDLYDYYAEVEQQILGQFFGEKSLGYQIIQDGFPRVDADGAGGSFWGDHLYQEQLVRSHGLVVNQAVLDPTNACTVPSVNGDGWPEVDEDRATPAVTYCTSDDLLDPPGTDYQLALTPVRPEGDVDGATLAMYAEDDATGARYPRSSQQSQTVLDEAGHGRFADPYGGADDRITGKLFVPQHSGIQPLGQEGAGLGYRGSQSTGCAQQLAPYPVPAALQPALGPVVAEFPIDANVPVSDLGDLGGDVDGDGDADPLRGCPNAWIVREGKNRDAVVQTVDLPGPLPPTEMRLPGPPQLTGFQTTNDVRSVEHVESALMNLVYNSNAVFIELYEDALWRIARTRGTGFRATALDDPAHPVRLAAPGTTCDPAVSCYSKNLAQWAAELHLRRQGLAEMFSSLLGTAYPGFDAPFPRTYRHTFVNGGDAAAYHAYIDPGHCDPRKIDLRLDGRPSALGVIRVRKQP